MTWNSSAKILVDAFPKLGFVMVSMIAVMILLVWTKCNVKDKVIVFQTNSNA